MILSVRLVIGYTICQRNASQVKAALFCFCLTLIMLNWNSGNVFDGSLIPLRMRMLHGKGKAVTTARYEIL
jgi:hypothetical protein